jgi:glycosyltransferase involved in cell wall biosynthesis
MKKPIRYRLFIRHPSLRDYRVPLFRRLAEDYDLFVFVPPTPNEPDPDLGPNVTIRHYVSGKRAFYYYLKDAWTIFRNVLKCDIFMTSFVASTYSILGLLFSFLFGKGTIVWSERSLAVQRKLRLEKAFLRKVGAAFVMGEPQRKILLNFGLPDRRIFEANEYPGIDYSKMDASPIAGLNLEGRRAILYLGRFIPIKGISFLLDAYKMIEEHYRDVILILAGDGELKHKLRAQALLLGIERIVFVGYIHDPQKKKYLFDQSSMLVVPSIISRGKKSSEGGPIVVLEALSAGLPVIGTDGLMSSIQFIKKGVNGFIVPHSNSRALADKMEEILAWSARNAIKERVLREFRAIKGFEYQSEVLHQAIRFVISNR